MLRILTVFFGLTLPQIAFAQFGVMNPCPIPFLSCGGGGITGLQFYFWGNIFPTLRIIFLGLALLMFFYYAIQLMFTKHEESSVSEAKSAYEMAIFGCVLIMITTLVIDAFAPDNAGPVVRNEPVLGIFTQIILYIKIILATVVTVRLTMIGIRMILLEGQGEGELEKEKKEFFNMLIGVVVILLANALVSAAIPQANSAIIANEIRGVANFLLEIGGALAVFAIVAAGIMLVVSVDEGLKDKAKKTISAAIIGIVVILVSFVLVNYFLSL